MAPQPYSERIPEPADFKPLSDELPDQQAGGDTPSPRTSTGSRSPPSVLLPTEPAALVPILSEDGIPYDYTLPHYIRQVSGEHRLEEVQNMRLRVLTETASLQQMTLYTPNLRELNLEGSALSSLRDIGSELRFLQVLRIARCRVRSLDGTLGLSSLRELHAASNLIASAAPCAHLPRLRILDLSRNQLQDMRSLSFLASCKHLQQVRVEGNPAASLPDLSIFLQSIIPTLQRLDDIEFTQPEISEENNDRNHPPQTPGSPRAFERGESISTDSSSSRVSSASSNTSSFPDNVSDAATIEPGASGVNSVSKLTSGQILCGNMASQRRRSTKTTRNQQEEDNSSKDELHASRRWREAYYKFRELNAERWKKEEDENHIKDEGAEKDDGETGEKCDKTSSSDSDDDAE